MNESEHQIAKVMAFSLSQSQHCLISPQYSSCSLKTSTKSKISSSSSSPRPYLKLPLILLQKKNPRFISIIPKSIQQSENNEKQLNDSDNSKTDDEEGIASATELGEQIKKAMKEREDKVSTTDYFWIGVGEEIKEIEWPVFNKVLGTTAIVLAVIAGSSVVLLTVNAVLAQLSDTLFATKGVQDFFT